MADERDHMAGLQGEIAGLREELERAAEREKTHDETRRAMLYMLEDLNASSAAVGMAKSQWEATFDSIQDPLCIHDREMRIVRCNRAYMEASGMSFKEIIGRPYYDVFPKMDGPFISCVEVVEGRAEAWEDGVNIAGSGRVFKVRGYPVTEAGGAVNFIHIMDDITEMRRATERTAQEMEVTRHLLMIAGATARTTDMTRLMGETAGCLRKIMGCDVSLSYLWDKERSSFQPCEGAGLGHESIPLFMSRRIEITDNFMKDAVAGKAPLVVKCLRDGGETDMKTETGASGLKTITAPASLCPFGWLDGVDTIALIPLSGREGALGLLVCIYAGKAASKGASFTNRDKDLMYGISQQVSTALEEARLYKGSIDRAIELSRSIETVRTMHEIDKSILSTLEPQEILEIAVAMLSRLVPCDRATIALADREKGGFVYSAGFGAVFLKKGALVLFKDTSATEVVETKRPQYAADLSGVNDPLPLEKAFVKDGFLSHLRVPLMVKGEAAGVLSVGS
ncbi:MAG: PAS domain-containing protein, partial [Deltaproteobacteria bacterium]|nr:PAS domain-containing protein [Deltaproteobacteria bacterium]